MDPQPKRRGRPPLHPRAPTSLYGVDSEMPPAAPSISQDPSELYGGRHPNATAPNATVMSYSEYQKLQQMKLEMQSASNLPQNIPINMNPMVPPPKPLDANEPAYPLPSPTAVPHNGKTDEQFDAEQRADILRQEAILAGKRRFKEIRTSLGLELYNYKNPNLSFLQKLNNLIQSKQPEGAQHVNPHKLCYPFKRTFDPSSKSAKVD